jgi:penicillin-binding protein 1A
MKRFIKNFFKDKLNIAICLLVLLVICLGIAVIGFGKTLALSAIVVIMIVALKFGGSILSWRPGKKRARSNKNHPAEEKHEYKKGETRKHKKGIYKILDIAFVIFLIGCILVILLGITFMAYIVIKSPKFDTKKLLYKEASVLYDKNGKEITRMGSEMRDKVTYDEIPEVFVDAIIATEDSRYFVHNGFDLPRFLKASVGQVLGSSSAGGASTITMQVSKNNFTSTDKSVTRKFTDIYMSIFKLEKEYTKEEILEFYVNDIHLGVNNSFGIAETSRILFGKEISDINLSQAALLAGMFQAPGAYNPYRFPEKAAARRHTVLYLMKLHGYITEEQMKIADNMPISSIIIPQSDNGNPYQGYIDYVAKEAEEKTGFDPMEVPMKIYTNLDTTKQDYINSIMNGTNFNWENSVVQAGIAVTDVNTGAILALGNGRNRTGAKSLNLATDISRQVGSTAKPIFDYGPGIEYNNFSTYTPLVDDTYSYTNGPELHNWDNKYNGMLTLRYALAESRNIPALKAFQQIDNKKIIQFAESLGITPEIENGRIHEAHAIGGFNGASPLQLAAAYAAFANGGYYIKPYSVNKVEIIDTGEVKTYSSEKVKVMSDSTAYMITQILKFGVDNKIIGGGRISGIEVAAKSGTSNFDEATKTRNKMAGNAINDLWYAGYTPDIAIGMWYGYEKINSQYYSKTPSTSGIRDKIFTKIATGIFEKNGKTFTKPSSVIEVKVEKGTIPAMLPSAYTPSNMITTELFKKGSEPTEVSARFNTLSNTKAVDATSSGSKITLTWSKVEAPNMITSEYLKTIAGHEQKYINQRDNENANILGTLGYNVYQKSSDGKLTLLGWTANTSYTAAPSSSGNLTYVVKTCYSIFKGSESTGSSVTVSDNPYVSVIDMSMNGSATVSHTQNSTYTDLGVSVTEDGIDVTSKATIKTVITKGPTNEVITSIDTSVKGITYKITYTVTYKTETETFVRTITII